MVLELLVLNILRGITERMDGNLSGYVCACTCMHAHMQSYTELDYATPILYPWVFSLKTRSRSQTITYYSALVTASQSGALINIHLNDYNISLPFFFFFKQANRPNLSDNNYSITVTDAVHSS